MTVDVTSLVEGVIAIIAVVGPIAVAKIKDSRISNAVSIVQSFLDLLRTYGKAIADGTITEEEYAQIGKEFVAVAKVTSLDKTIEAEIPGLEQATVDATVNVVKAVSSFTQ